VKNNQEETGCRKQPADQGLYRLLENVDAELAEALRSQGCVFCPEGKLHRADYDRKPRGGPESWTERHSFCCDQDGCRRRHTPPSVRFLGRKVWVGFVVVLRTALHQGLNAARLAQWRTVLPELDRRTVTRWRQWWQEHVLATAFWKVAPARFTPPLSPGPLPRELCERFPIDTPDGLGKLLRFLSPLSTVSRVAAGAM
jgi:hypothetical protein